MLNVTIQNDGKIKFQSECSSTKEMRSNVNLLKVVADDKHEILLTQSTDLDSISNVRNALETVVYICKLLMKRQDDGKCDLVLTWVDQNRKLLAVKEVKKNLDIWLRDAKDYIDSYCAGVKTILLTGNKDEVTKAAKKFDSSECLRVCVSKH